MSLASRDTVSAPAAAAPIMPEGVGRGGGLGLGLGLGEPGPAVVLDQALGVVRHLARGDVAALAEADVPSERVGAAP